MRQRLLCLVLCAAFLFSLAGCGSDKVNSFTWFVDEIPSNLDPQIAENSADVIACTHLYSGLFRKDVNNQMVPELCSDYTVSDDGLCYTFTLKSGVPYQKLHGADSGYTVSAADFVFAFRRIFQSDTASPYASSFSSIQNSTAVLAGTMAEDALGVSAPDDTTLVIQLSTPDEDLLEKLTLPGAMPCNQEFFENTEGSYGLNKDTILTDGSFYLYNWTSGGLFLRRAADGEQINSLRLVQNTDASGMSPEALVENGKCSAILDTSSATTTLNTISYSDTTWCLVFNCNSVFSNAALRTALAADAQQAALPADTALYTSVEGIVPPDASADGCDYRQEAGSAIAALGSGQDAFAQALSEVGADNLKGIHILVPDSADREYVDSVNSLWQQDYSLFFSVDSEDEESFQKDYEEGNFALAVVPLALTQSDPVMMLSAFSGCAIYSDPTYNALISAASAATGEEKCSALGEVERMLTSSAVVTPLYAQQKRLLVSPAVSGLRFDPFCPLVDVTFASQKS